MAVRTRVLAHSVVIFGFWPALTAVAATLEARELPYYSVSWLQASVAAMAGLTLLIPEFLIVGTSVLALGVCIFNRVNRGSDDRPRTFRACCLESALLLFAIVCGACIWYPSLLSQWIFAVAASAPSVVVLGVFLCAVCALFHYVTSRGRRVAVGTWLMAIGILSPVPSVLMGTFPRPTSRPSDVVVLGLDSIAQTEDVSALHAWIQSRGGAWYEHPVAPGLLTNAVWTSVLTRMPVRDHGVFHTFQPFPMRPAPFVEAANRAGYKTISRFSNQLTCAAGSEAGFDDDRSGPVGWRQLVLPLVENSSVLLPLFKPLLPHWRWMAAPPNHAGTFSYDVERDIREILTSGAADRRTLVAAHLTYLHDGVYPRTVDLSWRELLAVARAPAGSLRDRSFDWQDADRPTDPLPLHRWKLIRLQRTLISALDETQFTQRGGTLLVFSDHGDRAGLTPKTFVDERFHRVVLATVGLPRRSLQTPISLLDIGALVGIFDGGRAAEPVVEFTLAPDELWPRLVATSRVRWSGAVSLDSQLLASVFGQLQAYRPAPASRTATETAAVFHRTVDNGSRRHDERAFD